MVQLKLPLKKTGERNRDIPRSPHPSWTGNKRGAAVPLPLNADEFWQRLGI